LSADPISRCAPGERIHNSTTPVGAVRGTGRGRYGDIDTFF
jgi:hypothetical protein